MSDVLTKLVKTSDIIYFYCPITKQYGVVFEWHQGEDSIKKGFARWSSFAEKTK